MLDDAFFNEDLSLSYIPQSRIDFVNVVLDELSSKKKVVITGSPGSGKTFICKYIHNMLINKTKPVLITCRQITKFEHNNFSSDDVDGKLLLIDGIDELPKNLTNKCIEHIKQLKHANVIITSRWNVESFPNFVMPVLSNREMNTLLNRKISKTNLDLSHLASIADGNPLIGKMLVSLLSLDNENISEAIKNHIGVISFENSTDKIVDLISALAKAAYQSGDFERSLQWYVSLCSLLEPLDKSKLIVVYNDISVVYQSMGNYTYALDYGMKAVSLSSAIFDESHSLNATMFNNIGGIYDMMGDFPQAQMYYKKGLKLREKHLGTNHIDTANSYNNIAGILFNQCNYEEALVYFEKSLEIGLRSLGKNHPSIATAYNNIASVCVKKSNYEEALNWYMKALAIYNDVLGQEHPDTATTFNNIATVYDNTSNYAEALKWYEKSLLVRQKVLGIAHPDTATTYNNLASVYMNLHNYDSALEYYNKSYSLLKQTLGESHPNTVIVRENLQLAFQQKEDAVQ